MGRVPNRIFCEIIGDVQTLRHVKKMEQRSIVLYLARKALSPLAIHDDLVTTLGADADAVSHSSVTRYLRDAVFASSNPPTPLREPEAQFDDCDHAIMLSSSLELSSLSHQSESYRDSPTYQEPLYTGG
jgi:hypothetical protein